jgi:hypothetical protein
MSLAKFRLRDLAEHAEIVLATPTFVPRSSTYRGQRVEAGASGCINGGAVR